MEQFLKTLVGRRIHAFCGGATTVHGEVVKVEDGIVHLKDEHGDICYLATSKIVAVWEKSDKNRQPGFVFNA